MSFTITLSNVSKAYGARSILRGINLTIQAGETVALLGPSGGGKSTLLRCINGLADFDAGEIRVGDHVLGPHASKAQLHQVRRQLGMVFQDFQLFPHLSVLDNVTLAPVKVGGISLLEARERGRRLLERVGLGEHLHAWPNQLSGGQKQRVAIARALAMEPQALLCDEITSALDPELKAEVLEVVADLKKDGLTLILVTHEVGFARRAADRVVMLCGGEVLEEGPPAEILDRPRTQRMQRFLDCIL